MMEQEGKQGAQTNIGGGVHGPVLSGQFNAPVYVETPQPALGSPFMVEDLPQDFVPRPQEFKPLRTSLLRAAGEQPVAITAALRGAGGYGKTTLARALCHDPQIREAFPNGILWVTLGETPNLLAGIRQIYAALTGLRPDFAGVEDAAQHLAQAWGERRCLLVVDDVWQAESLRPFLQGGPCCARLVTTRLRDTLPSDARAMDLDAMQAAEAVALLSAGLPVREADHTESLRTLAVRMGCWPLLLKLINSTLREELVTGATLESALAYVIAGLDEAGLTAFDATSEADRNRAVALTIGVSLQRLTTEEAARYGALAVFSEDCDVPLCAVARLWQTSEFQTRRLCGRLYNLSLLLRYDAGQGIIRLHDTFREYLCQMEAARLRDLHRALVDSYRQTRQEKSWATAPDDGYLYAHLTYHLDALADTDANVAAELRALFANDAWLQVRVPAGGYLYDGYLTDLDYAWRDAEAVARQQIAADAPPDALAECVRYALIRTTVNSLAGNYEPELVVRAVEEGLWPAARALSVAAKMPDAKQRAKMYTLLLGLESLTLTQRQAAQAGGLAAAWAIEWEWEREEALAALTPHLTGDLLAELLAVVQAIEDERSRAKALAALAPHLTGDAREKVLAEGLTAARAIGWEWYRTETLAAFIPQLTGGAREKVLAEGLTAARAIEDDGVRAKALAVLAPQLTGEARESVLAEGLTAAQAIQRDWQWVEVLAALAPQLTGEARESALAEWLTAARTLEDEWGRAQVLAALAPQLMGDLLAEGLTAARAIEDEAYRAQALAALAPQLTEDLLAEGLAAARAIEWEGDRAKVLAALAPQLRGDLLAEGLAAAREIRGEGELAKVLAALAPHLTDDLLEEGLDAARAVGDEEDRAWALAALTPQLTGDARECALTEGLAAAWAIKWGFGRIVALAALAPQLKGEARESTLAEWLTVARAIEDEWERAQALTSLAPQLTGEARESTLAEGLTAARTIENEWARAQALAALAPQLTGEARESALAEGLAAARTIENEWARAQALAALAPQLTGEARESALAEGLAAARTIEDERDPAQALATFIPQLTGEVRESVLAEGLAAARAIKDEEYRAQALATFIPQLTGEARESVLAEGLAAAQAIEDEWYQARVLAALGPQLTEEARQTALAEALAALAPHLTGKLLAEGLAAARAIESGWSRARALVALLPRFSGVEAQAVRREYQTAVLALLRATENESRAAVLKLLADKKVFNPDALPLTPEAATRIVAAVVDVCRRWEWV